MKIIFLGITGIHHALVAAYCYLGYEPENNFRNLSGFADIKKEISGFPIFTGQDRYDNFVYALGCETDILMMKKTIQQLEEILGSNEKQLLVLPVSIPGERILFMLTKIAVITGAGNWYYFLCTKIVKNRLTQIISLVKQFETVSANDN